MKTKKPKSFAYWLEVAALGIVLGLIIQGARAWTEPTQAPPNGNVGAPLNTGDNVQEKKGSLQIDKVLGVVGNAMMMGNVGIGTTNPVARLQVSGGKAQADDFCLNSDPSGKCFSKLSPSSYGNVIGSYVPVETCQGSASTGSGGPPGGWGAAICDSSSCHCVEGADQAIMTFVTNSHWGDGSWGQCISELHLCIK